MTNCNCSKENMNKCVIVILEWNDSRVALILIISILNILYLQIGRWLPIARWLYDIKYVW